MKAAKGKITEKSIGAALFAATSLSVVAICLIFYFLFSNGTPIFGKIGISEFLSGKQWNPTGEPPSYGIFPLAADHACKIGEKAVYVATGERVQLK